MSNHYFAYTGLTPNALARSADVDSRFLTVQTAFDKLPEPFKLQQGRSTYVSSTGAANALVVALDHPIEAYVAGLELTVALNATNTGVATINVDGVGAKTIKRADGTPLAAGDLTSGNIVKLVYDGAAFRLLGASEITAASYAAQAASSASAAASSATDASASADAAAASAGAAATSETSAANSATDAAASAAAAATSETNVNNALSTKADIDAPTFTTSVTLPGAPTASLQAATKQYVDDSVAANRDKEACKVATTANITLSGEQTIDGILTAANRVLVKNQTAKAENGIYVSAAGAWTRAADMNAWDEVPQAFVFVTDGTANAKTGWVFSAASTGTLGTTAIDVFQRSAAGTYTASGLLELSGSDFRMAPIPVQRIVGCNNATTPQAEYLTGAEVTAMLDTFGTAKGLVPGVASSTTNYLRADGAWTNALTPASVAASGNVTGLNLSGTNTGDQTTITGNAGSATVLQTARTIAISGAVTGTATSFDGSANITIAITAMDVGAATTGTLAVGRGGTGTTTATGTGSVVRSASPTITGTLEFGDASTGAGTLSFGSSVRQMVNLYSTTYGIGVQSATAYIRTGTGFSVHAGGSHSNTANDPGAGGTNIMHVTASAATFAGAISGSNLSGTNTGDQTNITGNAGSATVLQTARSINGILFDGSSNITITANTPGQITFDKTGGAAPGAIFNGGNSPTISYNTVGAAKLVHLHNAADISSGILPVARGGTGVGTSTGSGSAVLSASPALTDTPTAPTAAWGTSSTQLATTAFVDRLRGLPSTSGTGKQLATSDRGGTYKTTGGVTVPASVFAADDIVTVYNNSAASITITQGAGLTLRQTGSANTGNRSLLQRGLATIYFISATEAVISGDIA